MVQSSKDTKGCTLKSLLPAIVPQTLSFLHQEQVKLPISCLFSRGIIYVQTIKHK